MPSSFATRRSPARTWTPLVAEIGDDSYDVIDNVGDKFLVQTNHNAPNWKVVLIDPKNPAEKNWKAVLPEKPEPLEDAGTAGGKLFATYLKDVTTRAYVYNLNGKLENEIPLPGLGAAGSFGGKARRQVHLLQLHFVQLSAVDLSIRHRHAEIDALPDAGDPGFQRPRTTKRNRSSTTARTARASRCFSSTRRACKLDGNNPTVLYGYGGFNITTAPSFSSLRMALLEQGVVYASANIRGGGEYGEKWHEAGTKLKKQNVFDDFIAAAEYLINNKYTSSQRLAIQGGSNGGLLVGAVANQRPDLLKAVIQQAGVMDMLRFHKFTIGWNWIADYGSSDNEAEFKALRAYSPIHNVRDGVTYPATLITTADHDDRVVPAHSFKYAAALQHAQGGDNPVLIRIDTNSGHGASSTTKSIEQTADIYSFIFRNLGVTPKS